MKSSDTDPYSFRQAVREALKGASNDYHNRLNQHSLLVGITRTGYSLDKYRKLLSAYYHLYQALEDRLIAFQSSQHCQFDYSQRVKLPWICRDLDFLGVDPLAAGYGIAQNALAPQVASMGEYTGVLYVIEGSMLGGQLISRSLEAYHGLSGEAGACFYRGYGQDTGLMWQDFLRFAENLAGDDHQRLAAEHAACQTFQFFIQVLDDYAYS
ncbi:biliverdin-producing heme oxygenase [Methylomonas sp. MK1]|uniref:biliverdin-producing heme oxygenase n=1 Tax=Methylomonas sp. MK1 TaxID=1131552 RepID=UPI001268CF0C|nr:biliverdin-producing heme oxygenase [Methylomonas sp. MK1]